MKIRITKLIMLFCFVVIILSSCNQHNRSGNINDVYLSEYNTITFPLDSVTPYGVQCLQYFEVDTGRFLALQNSFNKSIYIYNYDNSNLYFKLSLENKKDVKLNKYFNGFLIINFDTIFLLNPVKKRLYLIDISGRKKNEYSLFPDTIKGPIPGPYVNTVMPMVLEKGDIYINTLLAGSVSHNPIIKLNLATKKLDFIYRYPDVYFNGFWVSGYLKIYNTFNNTKGSFIYSFPADDYIYVTDHTTYERKYIAKSYYIGKIKPSFTNFKKSIRADVTVRTKKYVTNPSYYSILYDGYRNVYYRFTHLPVSQKRYKMGDIEKSYIKNVTIIILDDNFQKIGETILPEFVYTEGMVFITKEGLCMANWEESKKDENKIIFSVFKLSYSK